MIKSLFSSALSPLAAQILNMMGGAASPSILPGRSESAIRRAAFGSNKYTPFKGVSAEIEKHNEGIEIRKDLLANVKFDRKPRKNAARKAAEAFRLNQQPAYAGASNRTHFRRD